MDVQLRLIGDIHSNNEVYLKKVDGVPYTLQVGDLSIYNFDFMVKAELDPERHKFIGGNHDNYSCIEDSPHNIGKFGVWSVPDFGDIFYLRGAWSIDQKYRRIGVDWWPEEELSRAELEEAFDLYMEVKPKVLVSHECPLSIVSLLTNPQFAYNMGFDKAVIHTKTNTTLQRMVDHHPPKLNVFGHYHKHLDVEAYGTRYVCLPEFGVLDLPKNFVDTL